MGVLARAEVTLAVAVDVASVVPYYLLQPSMSQPPAKPTVAEPDGWSTTEPGYDGSVTVSLYVCQKTTLTDGTFLWSSVSLSSAYEAAKEASNLAGAAGEAASAAMDAASALRYDHTFSKTADGTYLFSAHLWSGQDDVTDDVDADRFVWWLRTEDGDVFLGRGPTMSVPEARAGWRASVLGGYEDEGSFLETGLVDHAGGGLVTDTGEHIMARIIWED